MPLTRDKLTNVEIAWMRNQAKTYERALVLAADAVGRPKEPLDCCALVAALRAMDRALSATLAEGGNELADELAEEAAGEILARVGLSTKGKH